MASTNKKRKVSNSNNHSSNSSSSSSSSSNHDSTINFVHFLEFDQNQNGTARAPCLQSIDKNGRSRSWQICIDFIPLNTTKEMILHSIRNSESFIRGSYYTISGLTNGKQITSNKKTSNRKNIGKRNETTPLMQTLLDMQSDYNDHLKQGYRLFSSSASSASDDQDDQDEERVKELEYKLFPMALHNVEQKKNWNKLRWPLYVQPKYDGQLFVVLFHPDRKEWIGYSRGRETFASPLVLNIVHEMKLRFEQHLMLLLDSASSSSCVYFIGELWKEGVALQDLSGTARNSIASAELEYWIFDYSFGLYDQRPFSIRKEELEKLFHSNTVATSTTNIISDTTTTTDTDTATIASLVHLVPTFLVHSKTEAEAFYHQCVNEQKLEGSILRNINSRYEWGLYGEKRVYHTMKWKPRFDAEFRLVDFKTGTKKKDLIVFILETDRGLRFAATPNWTEENRRRMLLLAQDESKWNSLLLNRLLTVTYSILSRDGIPQQPKVLRFRDPAIEEKVQALLLSE
jgi:hypothetical protein